VNTIPDLPTNYQKFIHKSRYARFRDDLGRREEWGETVGRYFDYFEEDLDRRHNYKISPSLRSELQSAVGSLAIMPSMRALMTAGEAARRENIAMYNCAYAEYDRIRSFAEVLYILMCGTGIGFSVERQVIKKLPEVPQEITKTGDEIIVADSKRGWAQAYDEMVHALYAGRIPNVNYSLVREAGARLITFGGRASGPDPLRSLMEFTIRTFMAARGRKLNSLEIHEIATKTGEIVVVGGVRRSAEISLSNLSDLRMRDAKSGNWYTEKPHLALSNNSVAYSEKPEVGIFMDEWTSIYRSRSGERGIFNRAGAEEKIQRLGRREHGWLWGANPCCEILLRNRQLCNLSESVIRERDGKGDILEKVRLASILGTWQSTQTTFKFVDPDWKINCEEERLLGVSQTGIYGNSFMRGDAGLEKLGIFLNKAKQEVIKANRLEAKAIGINPSVATTCGKPSGTVSELVQCESGIHQGHAPFYIRRVRQDNKDPVTTFMIDKGIPNEPDVTKPQATTVFSFPVKLGKNSVTRNDVTAIQHLELVKLYTQNWAEHTISCTISVQEHEWPSVGGWVFDNFDDVIGLSFLPHFAEDTTYAQLPKETMTEKQYNEMLAKMPDIDWTELGSYEGGVDSVTGTREFACVGNTCEVVGTS
jgi:ribonucleoside-triphosphate reductase